VPSQCRLRANGSEDKKIHACKSSSNQLELVLQCRTEYLAKSGRSAAIQTALMGGARPWPCLTLVHTHGDAPQDLAQAAYKHASRGSHVKLRLITRLEILGMF
jgi:hypothetical protein